MNWSPLKNKVARHNYAILYLIAGLIMIGIWLDHWWSQNDSLAAERKALLIYQLRPVAESDKPHPSHIYIQWFIDTPITDGTVTDNNWTLSDSSATYIVNSARPGESGNIIVYGHNTRQLMGNIRALKGYEKIKLTLSNGTERWYNIRSMHQVKPTNLQYLLPTDTETLTLFTCAGFADAERFVVQAQPI